MAPYGPHVNTNEDEVDMNKLKLFGGSFTRWCDWLASLQGG